MTLEKKVHSWKIPQGFLKKLQDLTKKNSVFRRQQASVTLPKIAQKISLGDIHCQKGGYVMGFRTT